MKKYSFTKKYIITMLIINSICLNTKSSNACTIKKNIVQNNHQLIYNNNKILKLIDNEENIEHQSMPTPSNIDVIQPIVKQIENPSTGSNTIISAITNLTIISFLGIISLIKKKK
jgi:hypothetical protein